MYRFHGSRRWVLLGLGLVVVVAGCLRAGFWQLDRAGQRAAASEVVQQSSARPPVPVEELLSRGADLPDDQRWRQVRAVGTYDPARQVVLRLRPLQGRAGGHVLTPLVTADGTALLVDRGFVPQDGNGVVPVAPPPPAGEVEAVARVLPSESGGLGAEESGGSIRRVDVDALARTLPYPVYGAWGELVSQRPAATPPPQLLPAPDPPSGVVNLAYAVQWFLFALVAVVGAVLLARGEARGRPPAGSQHVPLPAPNVQDTPARAPATSACREQPGAGGGVSRLPGAG